MHHPAKNANKPMKIPLRLLVSLWLGLLLTTSPHAKEEDATSCTRAVITALHRRNDGDLAGAQKLANQALDGPCAGVSPNHPALGHALLVVGAAKMELRDWAGAETALAAALVNFERALGPKHRVMAGALNDVGAFYERMGRYEKARELLMRAIAIYQEIDDKTLDVGIAQSYHNLANVESSLDHSAEAEQAERKSLQLREKVLGPADRNTIKSLLSLGYALSEQGKCTAAKREFELALARSEKAFGPNDPLTGDALNGIGMAQLALGHIDEAEKFFQRSLAIAEESPSLDPKDRASRLHNLGSVEYARHRYAEAESQVLKALTIFEKAFGTEHPELLKALDDLVKVNQKLNKPERAAMFEARAQQIKNKAR
jgi:tetratricopeptide (TPR) repeat protein